MKAVHIGAGNIGRGFIGLLLAQAGYDLTMVDINGPLISALASAGGWEVIEVGPGGQRHRVDGVHALHLVDQHEAVIAALAEAEVITTAVGVPILVHIAPLLVEALQARGGKGHKPVIMACENAIGATDRLREAVADRDPTVLDRAVWANTAVDRIVPAQRPELGVNVEVEPYFEWVIALDPALRPPIDQATFVEDLDPYIWRKLYTVNTGHCATAWLGAEAGYSHIDTALADAAIAGPVRAILNETGALLVTSYPALSAESQAAYIDKVLTRLANPALGDTVTRVGRGPMRKLSRQERFIGPIMACAQAGLDYEALLLGVQAGLSFVAQDDPEVDELQALLDTLDPAQLVAQVMGVDPSGGAYDRLVALVTQVQATRTPPAL